MGNFIVGDLILALQVQPVNSGFQKGINGLIDSVLELASAQEFFFKLWVNNMARMAASQLLEDDRPPGKTRFLMPPVLQNVLNAGLALII